MHNHKWHIGKYVCFEFSVQILKWSIRKMKISALIFALLCTLYMRKYCGHEKMYLDILMALQVLSLIIMKKWFWYAICLSLWMWALLAPEWLDGFYSYFSRVHPFWVSDSRSWTFPLQKHAPFRLAVEHKLAIFFIYS